MMARHLGWVLAFGLLACGSSDGSGDADGADGDGTTGGGTHGGTDDGTDGGDDGGGTSSGSTGSSGDSDGSGTDDGTTGDGGAGPDPTPEEFRACEGAQPGQVIAGNPSNYRTQLGTMSPGDTLQLEAGTYTEGLPISDMNGSEGSCFVIEGPATGDPAVLMGSDSRNTVSIRDSSYVVVRNLELDGDGLAGDGVKAEGDASYAHHIVLESLFIHGHGANQQIVGISTKCPTWYWVIRGNRIEGAGTGLYLGNSDGSQPFVAGLIERNVVLDTVGYNMQIKHQNPRPSLEGMPTSSETIVRHNVFSKANNASQGGDARPNLLLGHFPLSGDGTDDLYVVYGNFFYDNPVERLIQAEGNVALCSNVLVNPSGDAISIQPHNDVPRRIWVFFNTVVAAGQGIGVTGGDPSFDQLVVGNASYAATPLSGGAQTDNSTGTLADAASVLVDPTSEPGAGLDLHPLQGELDDGVDTAQLEQILRWNVDFDGRERAGIHRGAYAGPADPGAWALDLDEKP